MRVSAVRFCSSNGSQNSALKSKEAPKYNPGFSTNPFNNSFESNPVSFLGRGGAFFLKVFNDIHCPCCGVKMLRNEDVEGLSHEILGHASEKAVKALSKFEEYMHPTEKACFEEIKKLSKKNPLKSLNELLAEAKPVYLENLKAKEFRIFAQLKDAGKNLSKESLNKLNTITDSAKASITKQISEDSFKRKTFISMVANLTKKPEEKLIQDQLVKIVNELPASGNDVDAFIIKYAEPKRTSKEIGQRLLSPSLGTFEHVKPKSLGGSFNDKNGLLECKECNNNRGNILFDEFAKQKPLMLKNPKNPGGKGNLQLHIEEIIKKIKEGIIKEHDSYPEEIKETLEKESKNIIKLDVSEMEKIKKASESKELTPDYIIKNFKSDFITVNRQRA